MYQGENSNNQFKKILTVSLHHYLMIIPAYRLFLALKDVSNTGTLDFVLLNLTGIDSLATHHK